MARYLKYLIIAALVASYAVFGAPDFLAAREAPYILRAGLYPFFHASWLHLAVNCIAVWTIFVKPRKCSAAISELLFALSASFVVYPISALPVIGFSNALYAILGLRTPPLGSPWWRRWEVLLFLGVTISLLFFPQFSGVTHIAAFLLGMAGAYLKRFFLKVTSDARRFIR